MNRSELKVGGEYRLQVGSKGGEAVRNNPYGDNLRCLVMDAEQSYYNSQGSGNSLWNENNAIKAGVARTVRVAHSGAKNRVFVAVAIEVTEMRVVASYSKAEYTNLTWEQTWNTQFNPSTGLYDRREHFTIDTVWVPFAALTKDLLETWADYEVRLAEAKEQERLDHIEHQRLKAEYDAKEELRMARLRQTEDENKRRQGEANLRWKLKALPVLTTLLGEAPGFHPAWSEGSVSTVILTLDQAERLVAALTQEVKS